jgi:hypothetical protein
MLVAVALLVFAVALALLLLLRQTVREAVVVPILYLAWLGNLVFRSIHQAIFWALFSLAVAVLLFTSLPRRSRPRRAATRPVGRAPENRRVATWAALAARLADESRADFFASREFRKLIVSVWAYRVNLSPMELESDIRSGVLEVPPEWRFYFQASPRPQEAHRGVLRRVLRRLRSAFRVGGPRPARSSYPHLHVLIQSLEAEQEVARDP